MTERRERYSLISQLGQKYGPRNKKPSKVPVMTETRSGTKKVPIHESCRFAKNILYEIMADFTLTTPEYEDAHTCLRILNQFIGRYYDQEVRSNAKSHVCSTQSQETASQEGPQG